MPTRCNRWFLLQILLLAQHVSGHYYAHHQEFESIIQVVAACRIWCFGFQVVGMVWSWGLCSAARKPDTQPSAPHHTDNLKTKAPNTTGSNHLYNTSELLVMGIMVPETCWASNKICNKNHLLRLVGILFPHIKCVCSDFLDNFLKYFSFWEEKNVILLPTHVSLHMKYPVFLSYFNETSNFSTGFRKIPTCRMRTDGQTWWS